MVMKWRCTDFVCVSRYQIEYERNHQARSDGLSRKELKLSGESSIVSRCSIVSSCQNASYLFLRLFVIGVLLIGVDSQPYVCYD